VWNYEVMMKIEGTRDLVHGSIIMSRSVALWRKGDGVKTVVKPVGKAANLSSSRRRQHQ